MGDSDFDTRPSVKEFCLPDYILVPGSNPKPPSYIPRCPVLVFINGKSGGQLGGNLLTTYRDLLNKAQVFDLGEDAPDKVLHKLYGNLERLKSNGDEFAYEIEKRLRLIVAGGDGTASWLLGVVADLKLTHPPPVATVPLGTGNNLPFSFGWGKKNPETDAQSVKSFLGQVMVAKGMKIDSWHILMRMKAPEKDSCDPIAPLELPHSLHAVHRVSRTDSLNKDGYHTFRGGFWNYFSMGMDAEVSYAFHSERKLHPEKFKKQIVNQSTYLKLGCTQGWFCASLVHPSSRKENNVSPSTSRFRRNIAQLAKVMIMQKQGTWKDLDIPRSIRSIVCLNLPSFSGGLNPWGTPSKKKAQERKLTAPFVDDGLLEIVGFKDGWHGLVLLSPKGHGTRLAQAHGIRFVFRKGAADHTYMRLDGEPWKQPLPSNDETTVVEISHRSQVTVLAMPGCRSKSVKDVVLNSSASSQQDEEEWDSDEDSREDYEEKRKFGAADTFRFPEGTDISHLI